MPPAEVWFKAWICLGLICGWAEGARPRFDTSTDMGLVLIPADAEIDSVIFRLRATDQDADFPLVFEVTATITPVVRIDNLPCTLYNKVCQANVILTKRLTPGRLHDFAVRVRDTKGDSNSMQATISATNATTSRDKIFPHIPSLIMVPEDTKPGKELDYLLVRANSWSGKPVYIELWQPKELFTIRQRQTPTQTRGVITLNGELDFETQSMYTLTIYATDPYTEPGKDTRNIAGLNVVVVVQDVQDVPPIFTLAPPLTRLNNSVQTGDVILRVHAEDGDKGVPREITYGLVSEGNPFIPFFNISETTGEIVLARPLEELTQITHIGAPVVLSVVAEEVRRSRNEPPAQATVVEVGFLLGEPGNSPPYFENDNYITSIPENLEPGSVIMFPEQYSTRVHDEDIGKAGVFALKLQNNNGTFEVNPTVAERTADFIVTVRDNMLIDYEMYKSLSFKIIAQEIGPATNLSASATAVIFIQDINDNSPVFDEESYEVTLSENVTAGTRVIQVHATDKDTGLFGSIKYKGIRGQGGEAFAIDSDTGLITVAMGSSLDREMAEQLRLTVEARDEDGKGNTGVAPLIVNLLDVNDNAPIFEKDVYEFKLNSDLTNFTTPTIIKATDADAESPNNEIRYELIHGNYENKFYLNEITGELMLRSPITKFRRKKQSDNFLKKSHKEFLQPEQAIREIVTKTIVTKAVPDVANSTENVSTETEFKWQVGEIKRHRKKRAESDILYTLTARAYDLGVPHLASEAQILVVRGTAMEARIMMFVVPGERPNLTKTVETLATITGGQVTVLDTRPYVPGNRSGVANSAVPTAGKRTIVVARVEQTEPGAPLVDVERIRNTLAANGVGIIGGTGTTNMSMTYNYETTTKLSIDGVIHDGGDGAGTNLNKTISSVHEEVTVYKAENTLLFWLLIVLGLLMLLAIAALICCCICPSCPFYMAPRKRRIYSSETLVSRADGRPKRHIRRRPMAAIEITSNGRKQAWSADPTRRNWQFNRRNAKNGGLASLPGDVVYISDERPLVDQAKVESLRLRDGPAYEPSRRRRLEEQERMYVEDVEERKIRDYEATDADSLQRHEIERGSDIQRQAYRQRYIDPDSNNESAMREQHFYRAGNAEVLQLVTRGQIEDNGSIHHRHYPTTTVIVDGKDVLLQRFMQDQKARHEVPMQESEMMRTVESHPRQKALYQQEVLLLPEDLEAKHRHAEGSEFNAQKLDEEHEAQKLDAESQIRNIHRQEILMGIPGISTERPAILKDQTQSTTAQQYAFHDLELARQNVLLTRLLLEREARHVGGGAMMDTVSCLETQSLPGQVAIATQTDRAAATQTVRSRSDNDESDEDSRNRRRMKTKKRYGESDSKKTRTFWMKSPIVEEGSPCFDKRLNILRKKFKEVKERRKSSLEPEVLREISDSLDENGSSYRDREGDSAKDRPRHVEEDSVAYKVLGEEKNGSSTSTEAAKQPYEETFDERRPDTWSSPEVSVDNGKYVRETTEKKSSKKESKLKKQRKVESIVKPSFRVLEREITMLTKKLSKLADKKQTTADESTSQEKSGASKDSKVDSDRCIPKRTEDSKERKRRETSPSKGTAVTKTQDKFKYQQPQIMSPGSSDVYDDAFEKPKKSKSGFRQEVAKHKQTSSHTKVKRQTRTQIERKEHRKQTAQQDRDAEKRKYAAGKESSSSGPKTERAVKSLSRAQRLAAIGRRENVLEEVSTSTSSDRVNGSKDSFAADRDRGERSTESSAIPSSRADQRGRRLDRVSERFSDDFATEREREDIDQQDAFYLISSTSAHKRETSDRTRDAEIVQQFSDDFATETQTEETERRMPTTTESSHETESGVSQDFGKERAILKEVAEDIAVRRISEYVQPKYESMLDTTKEQRAELLAASQAEQVDGKSNERVLQESSAFKVLEGTSSCGSKSNIEEEMGYRSEKHEEEAIKSVREIQKGALGEESAPEEDVRRELETLEDTEMTRKKMIEESAGGLKVSSDMAKHAARKEERKKDGDSDTVLLSSKTAEDLKDVRDVPGMYPDTEDKATELHKVSGEELSYESKERRKEGTPLTSAIDIGRMMLEKLMQEADEDSLRKIQGDVPEEMKITATDVSDHQDITEKSKDTPEKYITEKPDSEKIEKDIKLTTEASEGVSDISESSKGVNLIDPPQIPLIGASNQASMDIDKISKELPKDIFTQPELSKITDVMEEDVIAEKLERLGDDLTLGTYTESRKEAAEESRVSPQELSYTQETELNKTDEEKSLAPLTEIITIAQEVADKERLQTERAEVEEESLHEKREKEEEELLAREAKEESDDKVEESLDKDSTDRISKDAKVEKTAASEPDTMDKSETVAETEDAAAPQDRDRGEQRADVSVPIFSNFVDTPEVSEASDSSSDISRKTTLSMRPYDTPRHRQKWQQQEKLEIAGMFETNTLDDERDARVETEEDTDSNLSLGELESAEDSVAIEAAIDKQKEIAATSEKDVASGNEEILSVFDLGKVRDEDEEDGGFASESEKVIKSEADTKAHIKDLLTTVRDEVPSTPPLRIPLSDKESLSGAIKEDVVNESIPATKEECASKSATHHGEIEKVSEIVAHDGKSEIRSPSSEVEQVDSKRSETRTESTAADKRQTKDNEVTRSKAKSKDGTPSISKKHVAKIESSESSVKKKQKPERPKGPSLREEKRVADDKAEEKTVSTRSRHRRYAEDNSKKRTRDDSSRKQPRRGKERKQALPAKSKSKVDKRSMISPKSGEIDTSKAQSKYMAWYEKKREEAEKKRLEKKVMEDEEQLPRWVSRSLKRQHTTKQRDKQGTEHKTPEMTPRTRRKIKPLVNIESEQLKAIVRQGRQLRKAEGSIKEAPTIQIFARTPPVSSDTQHRLLQHSEYKYEKVPPPFYLHPPPAPHPSPQLSPERSFEMLQQQPQSCASQCEHVEPEELHSDTIVPFQSGSRLRHQQLLEKKSVFDIAYSEAAPSQLRSDSTTPPS